MDGLQEVGAFGCRAAEAVGRRETVFEPGVGLGYDLEVDVVDAVGSGGEPDAEQGLADRFVAGPVEEVHGCDVRWACVFGNPDAQATLLAGQVGDEFAEVVMIGLAVLVLDDDGHTVL